MEKFLELVARAYQENEGARMADYCFVFPNKRSGQYFLHHLRVNAQRPLPTPEVTTMGEFVTRFSDLVPATPEDLIFMLYNEYAAICGREMEFDRFRFWGEMLINDFEDVDNALADASRLLKNVSQHHEIQSDYLTDRQREIINRYWPETFDTATAVGRESSWSDRFWKHVRPSENSKPGKARQRFLDLWDIIGELYSRFRAALRKAGVATQAMYSRDAAERLGSGDLGELTRKRYVFVGFNYLTNAELSVMDSIGRAGKGDYYWKLNSALLAEGNRASTFIDRYRTRFRSRYDIEDNVTPTLPESIEIIGVTSRVAQADIAAECIAEWSEQGRITDNEKAIYTAIVLPDESLLVPTVNALEITKAVTTDDSAKIKGLNVTMGLPYRQTPVASLMRDIVSLNLRATKTASGSRTFYHDDVKRLLTNPYIMEICGREANELLSSMNKRRVFKVTGEEIDSQFPDLRPLFCISGENNFANTYRYLSGLITFLRERTFTEGFESIFIDAYTEALESLREAVERNRIDMRDAAVFKMVERVISMRKFPLEGRPMKGLQVMGVLETRALDFDNIVILSMNENAFPPKFTAKSFIPENLRHGFGLNTSRYEESLYAYYFYSMISRARHVKLVYDNRKGGLKGGEMSRYIYQLLYNPAVTTKHISRDIPGGEAPALPVIEVKKTQPVIDKLNRYLTPPESGEEALYLSPSNINKYINCPLDFYLSCVEGLNPDDEVTEYMDSSTFGSVVHLVAEKLYPKGRLIDRATLSAMIQDANKHDNGQTGALNKSIREAIYRLRYNITDPGAASVALRGDDRILAAIIRRIIIKMMEEELEITPFTVVDTERKIVTRWKIGDRTVNFKVVIDRIDDVGNPEAPLRRFVDYKTGVDDTDFSEIEDLFTRPAPTKYRRKAILQLFIYCNIYALAEGFTAPIKPLIYKLRTLFVEGLQPVIYARKPLDDYHAINEDVTARLSQVIDEIFDKDVPFRQTDNPSDCHYCNFKIICNRDSD